MNQTRWSSFSAALLLSTLSLLLVARANDTSVMAQDISLASVVPNPSIDSTGVSGQSTSSYDSVKVGATQSTEAPVDNSALVARVLSHEYNDRPAATLYIRDIPVLTFLDSSGPSGFEDASNSATPVPASPVPSTQPTRQASNRKAPGTAQEEDLDPLWQAARVAASLNRQFRQSNQEADIGVRWDNQQQAYVIYQRDQELALVNRYTILSDSTGQWEEDALQATNRLRRLLMNDQPLRQVENSPPRPRPANTAIAARQSQRNARRVINGWASWYGPGFHGAHSASGEVFNAQAMTAAHLSLPFGTQVRVTNLNNGRSVVVRINDRGPYTGNRILDLSQGAAQAIGMINMGVAPVRLDVLSSP